MLVDHSFTQSNPNKVSGTNWNSHHSLIGFTQTRQSILAGNVGATITHSLTDANAILAGWSVTWDTNAYITNQASNTITIRFTAAAPAAGGTFTALVNTF